jgi:hypothetical protein
VKIKFLSRFIPVVLATNPHAHALTEAEITAAALVGKTLAFEAGNGTGLLPSSGSWTGKFESNANRDFSITNQGGIVADYSSRFTAISAGNPTVFSLTSIYQNSGTATLSLSLSGTQGNYTLSCVFVDLGTTPPTIINATQGGTFTIQTNITKAPEIAVKDGTTNLVDGKAKSDFGTVKVNRNSKARTYTITNKGTAALKNLKISASGSNKADFLITPPGATSIAPGKSTTFKLSFQPSGKGPRNAMLRIASNDADENPFDLKLSGTGSK